MTVSNENENKKETETEKESEKKEETEHSNTPTPIFLAAPFAVGGLPANYFFNNFLKKNTKPFAEREGDWICSDCKNLNFSFRTKCNRCNKTKEESEVIKENKKEEVKQEKITEEKKDKKEEKESKKEIEGKKNIKFKKEKFQFKESDGIETIKIVVDETKKKKQNYKNKHKKGYKKYSEKNKNGEKLKKD